AARLIEIILERSIERKENNSSIQVFLYLIPLSARTSTFGEIARPISFAVFRLMMSFILSTLPPASL
ncbi:MAG TPA: hypothetical protein VEG60_06070, partial [Candidatus Binatia bacterium]|nr:hypothetical protein [Candidatus Binatia bacterium]